MVKMVYTCSNLKIKVGKELLDFEVPSDHHSMTHSAPIFKTTNTSPISKQSWKKDVEQQKVQPCSWSLMENTQARWWQKNRNPLYKCLNDDKIKTTARDCDKEKGGKPWWWHGNVRNRHVSLFHPQLVRKALKDYRPFHSMFSVKSTLRTTCTFTERAANADTQIACAREEGWC